MTNEEFIKQINAPYWITSACMNDNTEEVKLNNVIKCYNLLVSELRKDISKLEKDNSIYKDGFNGSLLANKCLQHELDEVNNKLSAILDREDY